MPAEPPAAVPPAILPLAEESLRVEKRLTENGCLHLSVRNNMVEELVRETLRSPAAPWWSMCRLGMRSTAFPPWVRRMA
jgi:hypothetical protein